MFNQEMLIALLNALMGNNDVQQVQNRDFPIRGSPYDPYRSTDIPKTPAPRPRNETTVPKGQQFDARSPGDEFYREMDNFNIGDDFYNDPRYRNRY